MTLPDWPRHMTDLALLIIVIATLVVQFWALTRTGVDVAAHDDDEMLKPWEIEK